MGQTRAFGTQKKRSQAPQKRKLAQGDRPWAQHSFAILFTALGWLLAKISVIPLKKERERGKRREGGRERKRETERERYTLFSLICTIKSELTCGFALRSQGHQMMLVSWASRNVRRADMPTEIRGHVRWHPGSWPVSGDADSDDQPEAEWRIWRAARTTGHFSKVDHSKKMWDLWDKGISIIFKQAHVP